MSEPSQPGSSPHWNPYAAGVLLGLTLLASYVILGAGLGASGGLSRVSAALECAIAPVHTCASDYFGAWGSTPLSYYLVFMLVGVIGGGALSAILAGRTRLAIERGAAFPARSRLWLALAGGGVVGFASRLASGCTSGQALSGGAMLLTGSLLFTVAVFAGGYAAAFFVRRQWHD